MSERAGEPRGLDAVYDVLLAEYGPQGWWPRQSEGPDGALEVCVGAILVQHTTWRGAAAAIERLRRAEALSIEASATWPEDELGELLRGAGTYRAKARRLRDFAEHVRAAPGGTIEAFLDGDADAVRKRCLAVWGIGPETADVITLYAAGRPTFVVDAYARRLLGRLEVAPQAAGYEGWRRALLRAAGDDVAKLGEWHALIVAHGKQRCHAGVPLCEGCALLDRCPTGQQLLAG